MAMRPWIAADNIREYTESKDVLERTDFKLDTDITRAENYIINRTNNNFTDEKYEVIPADIKLAALLVAEFYAKKSIDDSRDSVQFTSETFKDYSYTRKTYVKSVNEIDIDALISPYVLSPTKGDINMKLRKL